MHSYTRSQAPLYTISGIIAYAMDAGKCVTDNIATVTDGVLSLKRRH